MVELAKPEEIETPGETPGATPGLMIIQLAFKGKFIPVRQETKEEEGQEMAADYMFELFANIDIATMTFDELVREQLFIARDFSEKGILKMVGNAKSGTLASVNLQDKAKKLRVMILPH